MKPKGLGDTIEKFTKATGIKKLSKIIPGISYNADKLEIEAKQIEEQMKQVEHDRKDLADNIYG